MTEIPQELIPNKYDLESNREKLEAWMAAYKECVWDIEKALVKDFPKTFDSLDSYIHFIINEHHHFINIESSEDESRRFWYDMVFLELSDQAQRLWYKFFVHVTRTEFFTEKPF